MPRIKRSLGESLVQEGLLTSDQLKQAQEEERRSGLNLRKAVVKLGLMEEEDLVSFLATQMGIPRMELDNYVIDPALIELVPEGIARKYEAVPVLKIGNRLTCAMVDPWNVFALDELRVKTQMMIEPAVATQSEIKKALDQHYGSRGSLEETVRLMGDKKAGAREGEIDLKALEGISKEPVVIKLVNLLVMEAIHQGASDIHIEPEEEVLKTRLRVDGVLREVPSPPKHLQSAVISRIKILAHLDIAERRMPQDGRFSLIVDGKKVDIRVSCLPTIHGENVVMRLLNVSNAILSLTQLGFSKEMLQKYERLILHPHGILLVTGPTGSGKTTTLYGTLDKINSTEKNIVTIEDPVEYRLPGIRQTQVNSKVQLTFATGLRSILRQDPDVIMVGEIRDRDSAEIAVQAALTGHLVLSTLHTNDAPSAVTRLIDMGVEPFLVSSSVIGILAQRLVRTLCKNCKEEYAPTPEALKDIGIKESGIKLWRGKGCAQCLQTGYRGRIGIFELMIPGHKIRTLVLRKVSADEIRREAQVSGMATLLDDGIGKIRAGLTTLEEVLRVTTEEK